MPGSKDSATYSASVNPPRRAKRQRTEAGSATAASSTSGTSPAATSQRLRPHNILPKDSVSARTDRSADNGTSDEEDEYDPVVSAPAPKRRGRKPLPMSRSARESQRKLNHSRIEKARRTKINETLTTLSNLVNEAEKQRADAPGGSKPTIDIQEPKEKEKGGEKEFKLDVLVKTVTHIQELIEKVKTLEARKCSHCQSSGESRRTSFPTPAPSMSPPMKRKRPAEDAEETIEEISDDEDPRIVDAHTGRIEKASRDTPRHPGPSPSLPPISAWLPHPYIDPSCIAAMSDANPSPSSSHLPTPPLSGSLRTPVSLSSQALPALTLPGPAHPLSLEESSKSMRIAMPSRRPSNARSPTVSPSWTPEDETAASLLLQMSSSPASSVSGSIPGSTPKMQARSLETTWSNARWARQRGDVRAETPSSLLGLGTST